MKRHFLIQSHFDDGTGMEAANSCGSDGSDFEAMRPERAV
jgi:hypothetical protein